MLLPLILLAVTKSEVFQILWFEIDIRILQLRPAVIASFPANICFLDVTQWRKCSCYLL